MAEETSTKKTAWDLLQDEIEQRSGLELANLPRKRTFLWVPKRTPQEITLLTQLLQADNKPVPYAQFLADLSPMVLGRHQDWPMNDELVIAEMVDEGDELHVYAVHKSGANKLGFRYRIIKASPLPVFGADEMPYDTWIDELVECWRAIDSDIDYEELAIEEEREAVVSYLRSLPADYALADAIADLEDENHLVDIEEPEEPEAGDDEPEAEQDDAANGSATAAPKPAAAAQEATTPAGA